LTKLELPRAFIKVVASSRWAVAGVVLLILGFVAIDLARPVLYQMLFDRALPSRDLDLFVRLAAVLGGLVLAQIFMWFARVLLTSRLAAAVSTDLQLRVFDCIQATRLDDLQRQAAGDIHAVFSKHIDVIERWLTVEGPRLLLSVLGAGIGLVLMFSFDSRLALATLVLVSLAAGVPLWLSRRAKRQFSGARAANERRTVLLEDVLVMQRVVRAFGLRGYWRGEFVAMLDELHVHSRTRARRGLTAQAATVLGISVVQVAMIVLGVWLSFSDGGPSLGDLIGFFSMVILVAGRANLLAESLPSTLNMAASVRTVARWITPVEVQAGAALDHLHPLARALQFEQLRCSYAGGPPVIDGVSLSIAAGERVGIVGPSGSGKSTLVGALLGFVQPDDGRVLWDGLDLVDVGPDVCQQRFGVVFQDTHLFNTSIRTNIRLGNQAASDADIEAAARAAGIHDAIAAMPAGYDTEVGVRGQALSGGQRQRIALARALVRKPSVLVLDEATSALDPKTEAAVTEAVLSLANRPTIISVTHRLHTLAGFDRIIVLDAGRVVETGTHHQLLAQAGLYASMVHKQSGIEVSEDGRRASIDALRLADLPILCALDDDARAKIVTRMVVDHFEPGEVIVRQGEIGECFYFIARGRVGVSITSEAGASLQLRSLVDGDYFGELALLDNTVRTATVTAQTPTVTLSLSKDDLESLLTQSPTLRAQVQAQAAQRRQTSVHELERARLGTGSS
jgi:ATP-binding cassette subfamily B protein